MPGIEWLRTFYRCLHRRSWRDLPAFEVTATLAIVCVGCLLTAAVLMRLAGISPSKSRADASDQAMRAAEVPLGGFQYVSSTIGAAVPSGDTMQMMEFTAAALVRGRGPQLSLKERAMKAHHYRICDLVDRTARAATRDELADPELRQMRGRLRTQINAMLGQAVVDDVLFSNFRCFHVPGVL